MLRTTTVLLTSTLLTILAAPLVWGAPAWAAPTEAPPAGALDAWSAMVKLQSLQATFEQQRTSKLLRTPLVATGTLRFRQPDQIAWIVETPATSVLTMSGTRMGMSYPDLGVVQEVDLASDPDAARLVQGLMVWLGGDLQAVKASYDLRWSSADDTFVAHLTPKPGPLASIVGSLDLTLAADPPGVSHVLITEPDGDTVTISFTNVQRNVPLTDEQLALPGAR